MVGFFVGIGLMLYGIFKYKDRLLTIIGIACMVFTVVVYASLFYFGFRSDFIGKKGWEPFAQSRLNSLVKEVEFYKLQHGVCPDSIQQLKSAKDFVSIDDPTQSSRRSENTYYNYKNLGDKYLLFSSGIDGIPHTDDDIFPDIEIKSDKIGWIREE